MPTGPLEAIVLRLRTAGCVFAEDEAVLLVEAGGSAFELEDRVKRRMEGEPLEYVLGWAAFSGLRIAVAPGVFVPRRRTEFLAEQAVAIAPARPVVLDLCCGAGPVGTALAARLVGTELHATDVDPVAAACARRNLEPFGGQVHVGDLYAPLPAGLRGRFDVIVANAPYVPTDAIGLMPREARDYELRAALDGGGDGLDVQRRIVAGAKDWLVDRGYLLIETSERQAPQTVAAFVEHGLEATVARSDDQDATVVMGRVGGGPFSGPAR